MLAICSAQPNWIPRKPKLMFQICQKLRRVGWVSLVAAVEMGCSAVLRVLFSAMTFSVSSGLLDDQGTPFVRTQGQRQPSGRVQRRDHLLRDQVRHICARARALDRHALANSGPREVE